MIILLLHLLVQDFRNTNSMQSLKPILSAHKTKGVTPHKKILKVAQPYTKRQQSILIKKLVLLNNMVDHHYPREIAHQRLSHKLFKYKRVRYFQHQIKRIILYSHLNSRLISRNSMSGNQMARRKILLIDVKNQPIRPHARRASQSFGIEHRRSLGLVLLKMVSLEVLSLQDALLMIV